MDIATSRPFWVLTQFDRVMLGYLFPKFVPGTKWIIRLTEVQ